MTKYKAIKRLKETMKDREIVSECLKQQHDNENLQEDYIAKCTCGCNRKEVIRLEVIKRGQNYYSRIWKLDMIDEIIEE